MKIKFLQKVEKNEVDRKTENLGENLIFVVNVKNSSLHFVHGMVEYNRMVEYNC